MFPPANKTFKIGGTVSDIRRLGRRPTQNPAFLSRHVWGDFGLSDFFFFFWITGSVSQCLGRSLIQPRSQAQTAKGRLASGSAPIPARHIWRKASRRGGGAQCAPRMRVGRPSVRHSGLHSQNRVANCCIRQQAAPHAAKVSRKIARF